MPKTGGHAMSKNQAPKGDNSSSFYDWAYLASFIGYIAPIINPLVLLNPLIFTLINLTHSYQLYLRNEPTNIEYILSILSIVVPLCLIIINPSALVGHIHMLTYTSSLLGLIGMHNYYDKLTNNKSCNQFLNNLHIKAQEILAGPKKIIGSFSSLNSGFKTLSEPLCGFDPDNVGQANEALWIYIKLGVYLSVQCCVSFLNIKGILITEQLFNAMKDKNEAKLYLAIYTSAAIELSSRIIIALLSYAKRHISIKWQTQLRIGLLTTLLNTGKYNYEDIQNFSMGTKGVSVNTSQLFDEDIDDLIDYTIIATSQLTSVIIDVSLSGFVVYLISPVLFKVALGYLLVSTISFAFWEKMSEYFARCKNSRSKFRNKINRLLSSWITLKLSNINILKKAIDEITNDFNTFADEYLEKIFFDRLGSSSKIIASTIIPMCCYVLAPEILSGALSFGAFMAARKAFKQFYGKVSEILGNIKMYVNFATTSQRFDTFLNILKESNQQNTKRVTSEEVEEWIAEARNNYWIKIPAGTKIMKHDNGIVSTIKEFHEEVRVYQGTKYLLFGGNGSGKSTILKLLTGSIRSKNDPFRETKNPTRGLYYECKEGEDIDRKYETENITVTVQQDLHKFIPEQAKTHREHIEAYLPPNILIPDDIMRWAKTSTEQGGLDLDISENANDLSAGTRSKQDMIRVLTTLHTQNPSIIFMDEIISQADRKITANFRKKFIEFENHKAKNDLTVVEISHHDANSEKVEGTKYCHHKGWNCYIRDDQETKYYVIEKTIRDHGSNHRSSLIV